MLQNKSLQAEIKNTNNQILGDDIMKNTLKRITTTGLAIMSLASATPVFAGTNINSINRVEINHSAIDTFVDQDTSQMNVYGEDIKVNTDNVLKSKNSYIQTYLGDNTSLINIIGKNIDFTETENTQLSDSVINAFIQTKTDIKNLAEK